MAVQVVERLVGNDARGHIHDVTFLDGLGLGVAVERFAEQVEGRLGRRGRERDEQLVQVVLANDLGELFLRVLLRQLRGVRFVRFAEWQADGRAHLAFLRAVRFINQERNAQLLQLRVVLNLVEDPSELLLGGDNDRFVLFEKARQVFRAVCQTHHVLEMSEVDNVAADVVVERRAVGEDERDVHQLLVRARLVEAVQPVGEPADRERLSAARRVLRQVFAPDVAVLGKVRRDIFRDLSHQAGLMVAREDRERLALRLVALGVALGHMHQKERKCLQQLLFGQHLAIEELDRVFVRVRGRVHQPHVVPAEVLLAARIGRGHHIARIGGEVEEGVRENLVRVVAGGELCDGVMHVLVGFVFDLQSHNGQPVQEKDEINFLFAPGRVRPRQNRNAGET